MDQNRKGGGGEGGVHDNLKRQRGWVCLWRSGIGRRELDTCVRGEELGRISAEMRHECQDKVIRRCDVDSHQGPVMNNESCSVLPNLICCGNSNRQI